MAGNQKMIIKQDVKEMKPEILSPKMQIRSPAQATAASTMSIISQNTASSSPIIQQGQPIIITTSASIPNIVSNTIVRVARRSSAIGQMSQY